MIEHENKVGAEIIAKTSIEEYGRNIEVNISGAYEERGILLVAIIQMLIECGIRPSHMMGTILYAIKSKGYTIEGDIQIKEEL